MSLLLSLVAIFGISLVIMLDGPVQASQMREQEVDAEGSERADKHDLPLEQ